MKKILSAAIVLLTVISFLSVGFCASARYADDAEISLMEFDFNVNPDGNVDVRQDIYFDFGNSVNGIYIEMSDLYSINGLSVEVDGVKYAFSDYASNEDEGVYTVSDGKIKVFMPSDSGEERKVSVKYLLNAVKSKTLTRQTDVADFYAKIITNWEFDIKKTRVKLTVPVQTGKEYTNDDFMVWGHTNADGICKVSETGEFFFEADLLYKGESFEIRALFPSDTLTFEQNGKKTKAEIIEEENSYAKESEAEKKAYKEKLEEYQRQVNFRGNIFGCSGIAAFVGAVILWAVLYYKYDREYKPDTEYEYYRELPENDTTPAEVGALWRFNKITDEDLTATFMNLKYKKIIDIIPAEEYVSQNPYFQNKKIKKKDFVFVKGTGDISSLAPHEYHVYKWFMNDLAENGVLFLSDIKKLTKMETAAQRFIDNYNIFKKEVVNSADKRGYFEKKKILLGTLFALIGIFITVLTFYGAFILGTLFEAEGIIKYFMLLGFIAGPFILIYPLTIKRRTKSGNQKYYEWKAFRKFLLDFSNMKEATEQSLVIWEKYLIYAIPLGVSETVIKQLKVNIPAEMTDSVYHYNYMDYMIFNSVIRSSIRSNVSEALSTATKSIARSQASASTGHGGGFSGGSFGGGGGGGFGGGGGSF